LKAVETIGKTRSVERRNAQDGVELLKLAREIPIRTQTDVFPLRQANEALRPP